MTSLTIIIPLLKETETELFETTLVSILENRPEEDDILVVNAAGYDNCYDLKREEGVLFCCADPQTTLIEAMNIGVRNAATPYICPLLCGCAVEEGWAEPALRHFEDSETAVVIPKLRKTTPAGREIVSFGYALSRDGVLTSLSSDRVPAGGLSAPGIGGTFFRRQPIIDLGLFQPALGNFAIADMAFLIQNLGGEVVYEKDSVLSYEAAALPALNLPARLTAQERLYRRWSETWTETAGGAHAFRLFKEKLFGGSAARRAYAEAKKALDVPMPSQLLAAAHAAESARR